MKAGRCTKAQIITMLREAETGQLTIEALCRKHAIGEATFYHWRTKYGGLEPSDAVRLKDGARENARRKKLLAERDLEIEVMKDVNAKKVSASRRRQQAQFAIQRGLSSRRACALFQVARSTLQYQSQLHVRDAALRQQLQAIAQRHPRYGARRAWALVRADGPKVNIKRVLCWLRPSSARRSPRQRLLPAVKIFFHTLSTSYPHRVLEPDQVQRHLTRCDTTIQTIYTHVGNTVAGATAPAMKQVEAAEATRTGSGIWLHDKKAHGQYVTLVVRFIAS
jgi:hypothetical protein